MKYTEDEINAFFEENILHKHISRTYGDDYASQISKLIAKAEKGKNYNLALGWIANAIVNSFLLDFNVHVNKESLSQEEYLKKVDILLAKLRKEFIDEFKGKVISSMMDF